MKKIMMLCFVSLVIGRVSFAQNNIDRKKEHVDSVNTPSEMTEIFTKVEIDPTFPGGGRAFKAFLDKNLRQVVPSLNNAYPGTYTVIVKFIVSKKGEISNLTTETHLGYGMEEEAIRVMKLSPKWNPATQNGFIVNAYTRQPIIFVVSEN
jgi:protein TonB